MNAEEAEVKMVELRKKESQMLRDHINEEKSQENKHLDAYAKLMYEMHAVQDIIDS